MATLQEENKILKEQNHDLVAENRELKKRLDSFEQRLKDLENIVGDQIVKRVKQEVAREIESRESKKSRANNIVLYNVEEAKFATVCDKLKVDGVAVEKLIRLGKRPASDSSKPRPLLICLGEERQKWNLLRVAKNLRNIDDERYRKIYVSPDLTAEERQQEIRLRTELRKRRDEGDDSWTI